MYPSESLVQSVNVGLGSYALHLRVMHALAAALFLLAYASQGSHGTQLKASRLQILFKGT